MPSTYTSAVVGDDRGRCPDNPLTRTGRRGVERYQDIGEIARVNAGGRECGPDASVEQLSEAIEVLRTGIGNSDRNECSGEDCLILGGDTASGNLICQIEHDFKGTSASVKVAANPER